jgi:hypothetical protein
LNGWSDECFVKQGLRLSWRGYGAPCRTVFLGGRDFSVDGSLILLAL